MQNPVAWLKALPAIATILTIVVAIIFVIALLVAGYNKPADCATVSIGPIELPICRQIDETPIPTQIPIPATIVATQEQSYFVEEFEYKNLDGNIWGSSGPLFDISDGKLLMYSNQTNFPYIYTKQKPFPDHGHFEITISFRYVKLTGYGTLIVIDKTNPSPGVGLTKEGIINSFLSVIQDNGPWPLGIYFGGKKACERYGQDTNQHILKLRYTGRYDIFLDEELCHTSSTTSDRPSTLWFGNPATVDIAGEWSSLEIAYIRVNTIP